MTQELFADLPLPDLSDIAADQVKSAWPKSLATMVDIAADALARSGEPEARAVDLSITVLAALARYHGGRMFYLPTGDTLDIALRNNRLWREYKGRPEDVDRFMRETGLTQQAVYRILADQRALHVGKAQGRLAL